LGRPLGGERPKRDEKKNKRLKIEAQMKKSNVGHRGWMFDRLFCVRQSGKIFIQEGREKRIRL